MSKLFSPFTLKGVTLRNRIAVPPMCQYMADDGMPNDWHLAHYTGIAQGGVGLLIVEATAVSPEGRITPGCLGIWNDEQAQEHANIVKAIKKAGAVPGLQIAHAGRKASANRPWQGDDHMTDDDPRSWETMAPSAIAFGGGILPKTPREMTLDDIDRIKADFVLAAERALNAGYEWLELHFAHGYLAQSFFSSHSNKRTDEYGGDLQGRSKFLLETMAAVRKVWPEQFPFTMRFGVLEFDGRDEETLLEAIELTNQFRDGGLDFMSVSIGFSTPDSNIPWGPAFMEPIAKRIKEATDLPVSSAWGFGKPELAEQALQNNALDIVMIGRAHLENPHWTYEAAKALGIEKPAWTLPAPYAHWLERYKI
jgi:2,4-dienoyl-CoA reductase-like NADH-dependent reductase (Old Yellow Enzyme family)